LIDTAILFARHENAQRISLETQKNNYQSHRLYEQMGFIQDSEPLSSCNQPRNG